MGGKPAGVTGERPILGVLEPDVFVQSRLLNGRIGTDQTLVLHLLFGGVFPQNVTIQDMSGDAFEAAKLAANVLLEIFTINVFFMFHSQVLDQIPGLRGAEIANHAAMKSLTIVKLRMLPQPHFAFEILLTDVTFPDGSYLLGILLMSGGFMLGKQGFGRRLVVADLAAETFAESVGLVHVKLKIFLANQIPDWTDRTGEDVHVSGLGMMFQLRAGGERHRALGATVDDLLSWLNRDDFLNFPHGGGRLHLAIDVDVVVSGSQDVGLNSKIFTNFQTLFSSC